MQLGFTADMDNAKLPSTLINGFEAAFARDLIWRKPDEGELAAFRLRGDLKRKGDSLNYVTDDLGSSGWVLENMWAGFPDPADFVFIGFNGDGDINAFGFFEDWPVNWTTTQIAGQP